MNIPLYIRPLRAELETRRGPMSTAEIRLGGVPSGVILVLCDAGGFERDADETMNGWAAHGFDTLAAEVTGVRHLGASRTEAASDADLLDDVRQLLRGLAERGWSGEQTGVVGWGTGGRAALLAAAEFELGAAASFSPAGLDRATLDPALSAAMPALADGTRPLRTPWLGLFGGLDPASPAARVAQLAQTLRDRSPVHTEVVSYPAVPADFYRPGAEPTAYAAYFDAEQRVIEWCARRVAPRLTPLAQAWGRRQDTGRASARGRPGPARPRDPGV